MEVLPGNILFPGIAVSGKVYHTWARSDGKVDMGSHRIGTLKALVASVTCIGLLSMAGACGMGGDEQPTGTATTGLGSVAIFTPSDGITLSQHTPLNKWAKLVPSIKSELVEQGFTAKQISTHTDGNLDKQSQDIQDYVVSRAAEASSKRSSTGSATTLIVAPCTSTDSTTTQYGDYVTNPLDSESSSNDADVAADQRMTSALTLARKSGMHVIVLSNDIGGFSPDAFVQMSTARSIGEIQAKQLVSKLQLDSASATNPKTIEVFLPVGSAKDEDQSVSMAFAKEAFKGIWNVLGPYFKSGAVVSASDTLNASTSATSWSSVAFTASSDNDVKQELDSRLELQGATKPVHIDGIIAMNDYIASVIVQELDALGYEGSSAEINPSISILGIVGNLAGHKDLTKSAVPSPAGLGQDDTPSEASLQWPIVIGYGAYTDMLPDIVNGKLWMTALEDRAQLATGIAKVSRQLASGGDVTLQSVSKTTVNGKSVPTLTQSLIAVSASNLKSELIDTGYVTLADAGL